MTDVGRLIQLQRMNKNLSIRNLACLCGISHSEVNKIENGQRKYPSAVHLKKIAKVLDINPVLIMVKAGYIDTADINKEIVFEGLNKLSSEELNTVQMFINFINSQHTDRK